MAWNKNYRLSAPEFPDVMVFHDLTFNDLLERMTGNLGKEDEFLIRAGDTLDKGSCLRIRGPKCKDGIEAGENTVCFIIVCRPNLGMALDANHKAKTEFTAEIQAVV